MFLVYALLGSQKHKDTAEISRRIFLLLTLKPYPSLAVIIKCLDFGFGFIAVFATRSPGEGNISNRLGKASKPVEPKCSRNSPEFFRGRPHCDVCGWADVS